MINQEKARKLWERTKREKFAVGAFNIDNQETLIAIARAARAKNSPVLVELSQGEVDLIGLANTRDLVDNYKAEYGIEMYINLDHCPSVEQARAGIDYEEIKKTFSTPEGAKVFVEATGIDTFAAAIGNLHGRYPIPKQLDIELLKRTRAAIRCAISLHGGSDTPAHFFKEAVQVGISKVNINSDMRYAFRTELENQLRDHPDEYAVVKLEPPVIEAVQKVVEEHIDMFGSANKAQL